MYKATRAITYWYNLVERRRGRLQREYIETSVLAIIKTRSTYIAWTGRRRVSERVLTRRWITDVTMIVSGGVHDGENDP